MNGVAEPMTGSALAARWIRSSSALAFAFRSFAWARSRRRRAMGPMRAMEVVEKEDD